MVWVAILAFFVAIIVVVIKVRSESEGDEKNANDSIQLTTVESQVALQPVTQQPAPAVLQQWTDPQQQTWRKLNDGRTQWWNGTDWQDA